jgi:rare lipoprotein A
MKKILSLGVFARIAIFVVVVVLVMSVSLLVQAHDAPTSVVVASEVATPAPLPVVEKLEMSDVPDGLASWYGEDFHGRRTASGARYDMNELTAAHKTLPFGTLLRVVNEQTGKAVLVEVTDRGPFVKRRVVDLSRAAARFLGVSVSPVAVDAIRKDEVLRFYENNDSTLMVFTSDYKPLAVRKQAIAMVGQPGSLTSAIGSLKSGEQILVNVTDKSRLTYSRVQVDTVL